MEHALRILIVHVPLHLSCVTPEYTTVLLHRNQMRNLSKYQRSKHVEIKEDGPNLFLQ